MIYLDYHATTPCDHRVVEAMLPFLTESFGNPASSLNEAGRRALQAVTHAREQTASLIGARPNEIVFTSGATESNNVALLGLARGDADTLQNRSVRQKRRIVTCAVEHKAVLNPCRALEKEGFEIIVLPVGRDGRVDLAAAEEAITDETLLVSVQAANNEIGTVQPIAQIAALAHEAGAWMHTDAAQAVGKIPVDVDASDVDLLSFSAHKLYGPKGIGALYVRGGPYALPIQPLFYGGGQEWELRPGTLNVPGIVGLGAASALCEDLLSSEPVRIGYLRDKFEAAILRAIPSTGLNGDVMNRLPGNSSLLFVGIDAEAILANTSDLALSTGSACTSGAPEPSHVLSAIGLSREDAYSTVRVGMGRFTTEKDVDHASNQIIKAARSLLERVSPNDKRQPA